jgi:hypothetical protein
MYGHPMTPPKPRWKSKTYWASAIALSLAGAESQLHFVQAVLPGNAYAWIAFVLPIVNMVIREYTSTPVGTIKEVPAAACCPPPEQTP